MPFTERNFSLKTCIFLLLLVTIFKNLNGFFITNCTVLGSLRYSTHLSVICVKKGLSTVPQNLPYRTRTLDISKNEISKVRKDDLINLSLLTNLNMSHNQIKDIEESAFWSLVALQNLNLAYNNLTTIPGRLFQDLSNLTFLRLDENQIATINPSAFFSLINLEIVNLSGNYLHSIQEVQPVFALPSIKSLYIRDNGFSSFQTAEISNTTLKLTCMDLSQNPLRIFNVTSNIFSDLERLHLAFINGSMKWHVKDKSYFRSVTKLNLNGMKMIQEEVKTLLQSFNSVKSLQLDQIGEDIVKPLLKAACEINSPISLQLQFNKITSLSEEELKSCTSVEILDLSDNQLKNISMQAFKSIHKLKILNLSHNKLNRVPAAIRNLSTLENLDLSYNVINNLTYSDFFNFDKLLTLHIYRNNLVVLEKDVFRELKSLTSLFISSNELLSIKGYFGSGLSKLQYLQLANNKLSSLHKGDFEYLHSLMRLDLDDNQIQNIEIGAFNGLSNLIVLNLQSNKITQRAMNPAVFLGLKSLKVLELNNNHIVYAGQKSLSEPPFTPLTSLESLSIYNQRPQGIKTIPLNFLEGLATLKTFKARNLNIKSVHPLTFTKTPNLTLLDLSRNELISLSSEVFLPIQQLNRLYMTKTGLQSIDFLVQARLTEIQVLKLQHNALSLINESVMISLPKLFYLSLEGNYFSCECTNMWFIFWTITNTETQVLNADQFKCNYPPNFRGHKLIELDIKSCIKDKEFVFFISTTALVSLTLLSFFLYHFFKRQVIYAYYIFQAYLYDNKYQRKQNTNDFQYDAFISYNTHDELWIMNELLPKLEGEQGWRLCLHHRDFQPGKPIIDNIIDSIYGSRKTICVISHNYLESEWCSSEVQVASFRLFDENKDFLILIFLEDIPTHQLYLYYRMKSLIRKQTYLSWPKPGKDTQVFWKKLKVALETRRVSDEDLIL